MNKISKVVALLGVILLIAGAGFHLTALGFIKEEALKIENPFLANVLMPVWVFPSAHWLIFGLIGGIAALMPSRATRAVLFLIAVALAVDASLTFAALGPFAGAIILGIASLCFALAAHTQRHFKTSQKMA